MVIYINILNLEIGLSIPCSNASILFLLRCNFSVAQVFIVLRDRVSQEVSTKVVHSSVY